jgi:hypothetical protein
LLPELNYGRSAVEVNPMEDYPTHEELLRGYESKPVTHCHEIDALEGVEPGDAFIVPDEDGDALLKGDTYELMRLHDGVRVLVSDAASAESAARLLRKVADWVEEGALDW